MKTARDNAEKIKEISGANPQKCMKCGKCSATCPAFNEMDIKPHQFVSYVAEENIDALMQSETLWKCLSCFACVERCPRDVKPGKLIDAARQMVVRQRGAAYTLLQEQLDEVMQTLTDREKKVLALRFGLEDGRSRTLEEVGKEFHVTRERIRQIEAKALRKLRHPSRSRKLKDYLD